MIELNNIKTDGISIVKDPFSVECIDTINIHIHNKPNWCKPYCYARVEFINGNTKGEQQIGHHTDFKVLMTELQAFMDSLQSQQQK